MYSELKQIFIMSMSNSEVFVIKGDQEGVEFDILKRPSSTTSGFHEDQSRVAASDDHHPELHREPACGQVKDKGDDTKEDKCKSSTTVSSGELADQKRALGQFSATDHDGDDDKEGFRTPTSLDHKIPEIKQCPPAPKKSKSLKRKSSSVSSNVCTSLLLDLSQEVNAMFPNPVLNDLHPKIKKSRREDQEN